MSPKNESDHWLTRPKTIRWLWVVFIFILALTVLGQIPIKIKSYFGIDGWFGFAAVYGFVSCVAMVLIAKGLGFFLKRDEQFYDD
jgi:membrane protease YdiL (CAAX protease family)